jgi:hypothetical protein
MEDYRLDECEKPRHHPAAVERDIRYRKVVSYPVARRLTRTALALRQVPSSAHTRFMKNARKRRVKAKVRRQKVRAEKARNASTNVKQGDRARWAATETGRGVDGRR